MDHNEKTMDKIVAFCKNRGFVYAGSEIYGGLANSWDYGPLGVEFKNNVKKAWLKKFVQESPYNVGLDAAIIMNPTDVGHDRPRCRAFPTLCSTASPAARVTAPTSSSARSRPTRSMWTPWTFEEMDAFIAEHRGHRLPGVRQVTTLRRHPQVQPHVQNRHQGVTEDCHASTCYLRPETAQGIFVNFSEHPAHDAPEDPVRRLPGRQGVPQRDHAGQLHVPHARV